MTYIKPPTHCPSCNTELVEVNYQLYCRNNNCGSQTQKKLEHFAKALKIKGLGPSSIAKLNISTIADLYELTQDDLAEALSSEKIAEKLFDEIQNSLSAPAEMLLPAFSIPLIGNSAAQKLSTSCTSIYDITRDTCKAAAIGPKATDNLIDWHENEFLGYIQFLPLNFNFSGDKSHSSIPLDKGVVCITGKLKSFKTKAEAKQALEGAGYTVKDSLTKQVTILVNESGIESSKTQQARNSGVTIITNLFDLIGE